ncbi:phage/plasmid primase, P4 family [Lysinibacillus sp. FSL M8-0216]|uniref:phage/plasmid primase, P4 family n=1 Tax=Lysinibacillus sp. FSL M8-0216 TaxID=2921619 RepID=UPI00315A8A3A
MYWAIPEELKKLKQWCCFKLQPREDKMTKIPVSAYDGSLAKSNDENTWSDFETALEAIEKFNLDGLGFFFKAPYFGIDIDGVKEEIERFHKDDHDNNIVSEFIDMMCSYSEISVSGTGIHIIAKGELPEGARRRGNIEMYDSGRFFVMTGNQIGVYTRVEDDEFNKINYLHNKYLHKPKVPESRNETNASYGTKFTEDELINIATKSKIGGRFQVFMNGGWEQFYNSQSEADMSFCNDLAFWTNCDYTMMDSIFRRSSLMRDKWDREQNSSTYGDETLRKAITDCTNTFDPEPRKDGESDVFSLEGNTKKVERKYYSFDDTGNAQRLRDAYGDHIRYSYIRKNWYYYDGKIWQIDQEGMIKMLVDKTVEKMKNEALFIPEGVDEEEVRNNFIKHIKATRSSKGKTNMLKETEHLTSVKPSQFDSDIDLFNVQNGYLDLKTSTLMEHDKSKYFTKISNVEFTDKIGCSLWLEFLDQIFDGDKALIDYMQRAVGYSLSGSTQEQMMFILYGNGRNGKSVFLDIITEMFGSYATNIQPQTIMVKQQSSGANSDIARLAGARLVTTTEPNEGVRLDEGLVKQLTGGDKVTARFLYENEFDFEPQFKLWMATNHKPIIRGTDDGIWRRLAIIPFTVQIPENKIDYNLTNKLKREITAILNWAVEGYLKWQKDGLKEPEIIKQQRQEYRVEMDSIECFIEECCIKAPQFRVPAKTLFNEYKNWASDNGQYMMSSTKFGREMGKKFNKIKTNGTMHYAGVRLLEKYDTGFFKTDD